MEIIKYFEDRSITIVTLHQHRTVKQMFLKYNTPIPSSAPVERLFSYAGMVLTKKKQFYD